MLIFERDRFDLSKPLVRLSSNIPKIEAQMDPECYVSYDSFLRTQVFNNVDSTLAKNLPSEKREEIERFKSLDTFNEIEQKIQQKRTAFTDALRQQQAMQELLAEYETENGQRIETPEPTYFELPNISETNRVSPEFRKSSLPAEHEGQKLKGLEDSPLKVKKTKGTFEPKPSLVTDYAGSKGPKWVAMYQPPYKSVYRAEIKKPNLIKTTTKRPTSKSYVRGGILKVAKLANYSNQ